MTCSSITSHIADSVLGCVQGSLENDPRRTTLTHEHTGSCAVTLPPEVGDIVLDFLCSSYESQATDGKGKKELQGCALVSEHWSHRCRDIIFRRIKLSSHVDLQEFVALIKHRPTILKCICWLEVAEQHEGWLHLLPFAFAKWKDSFVLATVDIGRSPSCASTVPFLYRGLPVFRSMFSTTSVLRVTNTRLCSLMDVLRLAGSMACLQSITCQQLSWWGGARPVLPRLPRTPPGLMKVHIIQCRECWSFLSLFCPSRSRAIENARCFMRPALDEHAFSAIAMVSRVFAPLLDREDILFSLSKDSTGDSNQWHFVIRSGIEPRRKGTVALDFTLNESEGFNDRTLHLLAIRVDGIHNYAPQELDALSWDDLDGLAILPYVPDLTIVLPWKPELMSQEDVVRISGSVRLCLAQLSLLSKLRFPQIYPNIRVVPAKQASRDNDVPGQELSLPIQQELCRS